MKAEMNGLNEDIVKLLIRKNMTVAAAESCTGGLLAALLTNVSGASDVMNESIVTYANAAKIKYLGVNEDTLSEYGAVSAETAFAMARGLYDRTDANVTVGITGIAGPEGGTAEKPVGLVYAGICINGNTEVLQMNHIGNREEVREKTCIEVLKSLKEKLAVL